MVERHRVENLEPPRSEVLAAPTGTGWFDPDAPPRDEALRPGATLQLFDDRLLSDRTNRQRVLH